jgi:LigD-like primase-polymerase
MSSYELGTLGSYPSDQEEQIEHHGRRLTLRPIRPPAGLLTTRSAGRCGRSWPSSTFVASPCTSWQAAETRRGNLESGQFGDAARAGLRVKAGLELLKLRFHPKTSGSRELRVLVPLVIGPDADVVLAFAESLVAKVASMHPDELAVAHAIAARRARVCLDPFCNGFWPERLLYPIQ